MHSKNMHEEGNEVAQIVANWVQTEEDANMAPLTFSWREKEGGERES